MKRTLIGLFAATGLLILAACSSASSPKSTGSSSSPTSTSTHNQADVAFATNMIPHHGQAIEMAGMALEKATNAQLKVFATRIKAAQSPEIATMSEWLTSWGQPVPDATMGHSSHGMNMPSGMMSAGEMAELQKASGAAFDKLWLTMMTTHHQGALGMANNELRVGQNAEAKSLATAIIAGQTAEIAEFRQLLTSLGS